MFGKKNTNPAVHIIAWIICIVLLFTTLAAFYGVYVAHFGYDGATFGSGNSSLSLLALGVNIGLLAKALYCCMGAYDKK